MILMTLKLNYIVNEHFFPILSIFTLRDFLSNSRLINIHLLFGLPFGQYTLSLDFSSDHILSALWFHLSLISFSI